MAAGFRDGAVVGLCLMAMVVVGSIGAEAQLSTQFYDTTCPQIYDIVKEQVQIAVANRTRNAAFLVRLHFHDCFVNGCDGSILLDSVGDGLGANMSEQFVLANANSIGGLDVIATIKAQLEAACPQTVSCADIVALASRDSAVEAGLSPGYPVFFGRRDSLNFSANDANNFLPSPLANYSALKQKFENVTLDEVDLVALSGAHTIGRVNCSKVLLSSNDTTFGQNATFQQANNATCFGAPNNTTKVLNLDLTTPDTFDNWYYKNILVGKGILESDMALFTTAGSIGQALVAKFAFDEAAFFEQFALSTIKMGNLRPLTGTEGEIRLNCSVINNATANIATSPSAPVESLVATQ